MLVFCLLTCNPPLKHGTPSGVRATVCLANYKHGTLRGELFPTDSARSAG